MLSFCLDIWGVGFQFPYTALRHSSQEDVFADCRGLMASAVDGFNVTVLGAPGRSPGRHRMRSILAANRMKTWFDYNGQCMETCYIYIYMCVYVYKTVYKLQLSCQTNRVILDFTPDIPRLADRFTLGKGRKEPFIGSVLLFGPTFARWKQGIIGL